VRFVYSHVRGVVSLLNEIYTKEGIRALWKGLGPNLVGVVPARSIHFAVYTQSKHFLTQRWGKETPAVHMLSAGGIASTLNTKRCKCDNIINYKSNLACQDTHAATKCSYKSKSTISKFTPLRLYCHEDGRSSRAV
jgi:hypothetical protein